MPRPETDMSPLDVLLSAMRCHHAVAMAEMKAGQTFPAKESLKLATDCAKAAAPYVHARVRPADIDVTASAEDAPIL